MSAIARLRAAARAAAPALLALAACFPATGRVRAQSNGAEAFAHEPHREVSCLSCHESRAGKVGPAAVTPGQCRSCHHKPSQAATCTRCHEQTELSQRHRSTQPFRFSVVAAPISRELIFDHQRHERVPCGSCHQLTGARPASTLACSSCHQQHHEPNVECRSCHEAPRAGAHGMRAHLGCAGADCHRASPVQANARTRQLCLSCHPQQDRHHPATACSDCHVLPMSAPRPANGS